MTGREATRQAATGQAPMANLLTVKSRWGGRRVAVIKGEGLLTPTEMLTRVRLRNGRWQGFFPPMELLPTLLVYSPLSRSACHCRRTLAETGALQNALSLLGQKSAGALQSPHSSPH